MRWAKARDLGVAWWANSRSRRAHQAALQQANLTTLRSELLPHDLRPLDHRLDLGEGDVAREVFHAAIGGDDDPLGRHMRQRTADTRRHRLRRLDGEIAKIDHAEDDSLAQTLELRAVELGLRGLDR